MTETYNYVPEPDPCFRTLKRTLRHLRQPMEKAPKDGSNVLLIMPNGYVANGFWDPRFQAWNSNDKLIDLTNPQYWLPGEDLL